MINFGQKGHTSVSNPLQETFVSPLKYEQSFDLFLSFPKEEDPQKHSHYGLPQELFLKNVLKKMNSLISVRNIQDLNFSRFPVNIDI